MMKKSLLALTLSAIILNPVSALACRYENIEVDNGVVKGRWIPCNDENCPDYQRHFQAIKNQNVHVTDVAPAKPVDRFAFAEIKINDDGEVVEPAKEEQQEVTEEDEVKQEEQETEEQKENTGKVYDKKQHRERDVDAVNAEREAIDKVTGELPEQKQEEKKEPVEKKVIKEIGKIFGF